MIRKNKKFIDPRYFMEEKVEGGVLDQLDEMAYSAGAMSAAGEKLDKRELWTARYNAWNLYRTKFNEFHTALEEAGGYAVIQSEPGNTYYSRPVATMWEILLQAAQKYGMVSSEPRLADTASVPAGAGEPAVQLQQIKVVLEELISSEHSLARQWLKDGIGAMNCDGEASPAGHCKILKNTDPTIPPGRGFPQQYFTPENITELTAIIDKIGSVSQPGAEATQEAP